jgi:hypothetical protein
MQTVFCILFIKYSVKYKHCNSVQLHTLKLVELLQNVYGTCPFWKTFFLKLTLSSSIQLLHNTFRQNNAPFHGTNCYMTQGVPSNVPQVTAQILHFMCQSLNVTWHKVCQIMCLSRCTNFTLHVPDTKCYMTQGVPSNVPQVTAQILHFMCQTLNITWRKVCQIMCIKSLQKFYTSCARH